jgi:hypothetical protein
MAWGDAEEMSFGESRCRDLFDIAEAVYEEPMVMEVLGIRILGCLEKSIGVDQKWRCLYRTYVEQFEVIECEAFQTTYRFETPHQSLAMAKFLSDEPLSKHFE